MDQRGCGESRPHAGESLSALEAHTTVHLIAGIDRLRRHLGVTAWAVFGASSGSTLARAYALFHPDAVRALLLMGVTTTGPGEIDWLYGYAGQCLPEAFGRFQRQSRVPGASGRALAAASRRRLCAPDAATLHAAAEAWCDWDRGRRSGPPLAALAALGRPELAPRFRPAGNP